MSRRVHLVFMLAFLSACGKAGFGSGPAPSVPSTTRSTTSTASTTGASTTTTTGSTTTTKTAVTGRLREPGSLSGLSKVSDAGLDLSPQLRQPGVASSIFAFYGQGDVPILVLLAVQADPANPTAARQTFDAVAEGFKGDAATEPRTAGRLTFNCGAGADAPGFCEWADGDVHAFVSIVGEGGPTGVDGAFTAAQEAATAMTA